MRVEYNLSKEIADKWIESIDEAFKISGLICLDIQYCGSLRRKKSYIGDIDLIVKLPFNVEKDFLESIGYCLKGIREEVKSYTISSGCILRLCLENSLFKKIDIFIPKVENYYSSKVFATGSARFNNKVKKLCLSKNLVFAINNFHHIENREKIHLNSERDFFKFLDLDYLEPENR